MDLVERQSRRARERAAAAGGGSAWQRLIARKSFTLGVLTFINLFNYVDRYVPSATKELIKKDLKLNDTETALPLTAFMVVYMCASPVFGNFADRGVSRRKLIGGGILVWSFATSLGAFSWNFGSFLVARAFVGIGEAAYATIAPVLIADLYPAAEVSGVLSIFYTAIPIGAAIGYLIGGWIGGTLGWRAAFFLAGLPGLVLAGLVYWIQDPQPGVVRRFAQSTNSSRTRGGGRSVVAAVVPGAHDDVVADDLLLDDDLTAHSRTGIAVPSWKETLFALSHNGTFILIVLGQTCVAWAAGGMADWMPAFLQRRYGVSVEAAGTIVGAVTVVAGIAGTMSGPYAVHLLRDRAPNGNFAVPALSMAPAAVFALFMLFTTQTAMGVTMLLLSEYFLWYFQGPTNAELTACVPAAMRTRAFSVSIFCQHALGDAISPTIIGGISDATKSLRTALVLVPFVFAAAGLIWGAGAKRALAVADGHDLIDGTIESGASEPSTDEYRFRSESGATGGPFGDDEHSEPL